MEVTLAKSLNFGINWKATGATDNNRILSGGFPGGGAFDAASAAAASGTLTLVI